MHALDAPPICPSEAQYVAVDYGACSCVTNRHTTRLVYGGAMIDMVFVQSKSEEYKVNQCEYTDIHQCHQRSGVGKKTTKCILT